MGYIRERDRWVYDGGKVVQEHVVERKPKENPGTQNFDDVFDTLANSQPIKQLNMENYYDDIFE